jgi:hypothetical protein
VNKKIQNVVVVSILGGILVAIGCWILFGETSISQAHRMNLAREHASVITNSLYSHPEFKGVEVLVGTSPRSPLLIMGTIQAENQRAELQRLIAATKPPVTVFYDIKVFETNSDVKR